MTVGEVISQVGRRRFVAECHVGYGVFFQLEMSPEAVLTSIRGHIDPDARSVFRECNGCAVALFNVLTPEPKEAA